MIRHNFATQFFPKRFTEVYQIHLKPFSSCNSDGQKVFVLIYSRFAEEIIGMGVSVLHKTKNAGQCPTNVICAQSVIVVAPNADCLDGHLYLGLEIWINRLAECYYVTQTCVQYAWQDTILLLSNCCSPTWWSFVVWPWDLNKQIGRMAIKDLHLLRCQRRRLPGLPLKSSLHALQTQRQRKWKTQRQRKWQTQRQIHLSTFKEWS